MNRFMEDLYNAGMGHEVHVGGERQRRRTVVGEAPHVEVTPASYRASLERTRSLIESLGRDVSTGPTPESWRLGWTDFLSRWGTFLADYPADQDYSADQLEDAAVTMATYADEARRWKESFKQAGGHVTEVPDAAPHTAVQAVAQVAKKVSPVLWLVGGAVAILGAIVVFKKEAPPDTTGGEGT